VGCSLATVVHKIISPNLHCLWEHVKGLVCHQNVETWYALLCCSVLQPFKGQSYWTDATYTFSSQMSRVMLKHTWIRVWAASSWQYSRGFFSGPLFMGINLLFVSTFTMRCSSLGTKALNKCKFEFNKFSCGNISNRANLCFFYILCIVPKYPIFLFENGTYMIIFLFENGTYMITGGQWCYKS